MALSSANTANVRPIRPVPERLSHVNASVLKVKLDTAFVGISFRLESFINAANSSDKGLIVQTAMHTRSCCRQ